MLSSFVTPHIRGDPGGTGATQLKVDAPGITTPVINITLMAAKATIARIKLLIGPAAETIMFALVLSLHSSGFVCTGLAQPNIAIPPFMNPIRGIKIVPIGSMWTIGFRDMRPWYRPV
jgi:hypothetical protein